MKDIVKDEKSIFVLGGAASGKSAFAEDYAVSLSQKHKSTLCYVATLRPDSGGDTALRIQNHRASRKDKGFVTYEWLSPLEPPVLPKHACILIEDFGNLVANYLYPPQKGAAQKSQPPKNAGEAVCALLQALDELTKDCDALVCVSNEISLGGALPEGAAFYGEVLASLNTICAKKADATFIVIAGIPVPLR